MEVSHRSELNVSDGDNAEMSKLFRHEYCQVRDTIELLLSQPPAR
jgi:hypothetical protein